MTRFNVEDGTFTVSVSGTRMPVMKAIVTHKQFRSEHGTVQNYSSHNMEHITCLLYVYNRLCAISFVDYSIDNKTLMWVTRQYYKSIPANTDMYMVEKALQEYCKLNSIPLLRIPYDSIFPATYTEALTTLLLGENQ